MLLNDPPAGYALVLDDAEVAMPLAVLLANLLPQKHGGAALFTDRPPGKQPWSTAVFARSLASHTSNINCFRDRENHRRGRESANFG